MVTALYPVAETSRRGLCFVPSLPRTKTFSVASGQKLETINGVSIATVSRLLGEALDMLFNGRIAAIRFPNFYDKRLAKVLSDWIVNHPDRTEYGQNVADPDNPGKVKHIYYQVDRVGIPKNLFIRKSPDHPDWDLYFRKKVEIESAIRKLTNSRHPIDEIIEQMNYSFFNGAERDEINGKEAFAGIARVTVPGKDSLLERYPHVDGTWPCDGHFSVNVYLSMPKNGGELEIFNGPVLTANEVSNVTANRDFRTEGYRSTLVQPEVGDLIIFNTRRPHAVKTYRECDGIRVSLASFFLHDYMYKPLRFYS